MVNVDKIIKFEQGDMNDEEIMDLFQELIDEGKSWGGRYGRLANELIKRGICRVKEDKDE
jgi:hypothetical protein